MAVRARVCDLLLDKQNKFLLGISEILNEPIDNKKQSSLKWDDDEMTSRYQCNQIVI